MKNQNKKIGLKIFTAFLAINFIFFASIYNTKAEARQTLFEAFITKALNKIGEEYDQFKKALNLSDENGTYLSVKSQKVGVKNENPIAQLDINGAVKVGYVDAACTEDLSGTIRYNKTNKTMELCANSAWLDLADKSCK